MKTIFWINFGITLFYIFSLWNGYRKGFLWKCISLLSFCVIGYIAWVASGFLTNIISIYPLDMLMIEDALVKDVIYNLVNRVCIFIILFIVIMILIHCVRPIVKILDQIPVVSFVNRIFGMIFGALQAVLIVTLIGFICSLNLFKDSGYYANESFLSYHILLVEPIMDNMNYLSKYIEKQTENIQSEPLNNVQKKELEKWFLQQNMKEENVKMIIDSLR